MNQVCQRCGQSSNADVPACGYCGTPFPPRAAQGNWAAGNDATVAHGGQPAQYPPQQYVAAAGYGAAMGHTRVKASLGFTVVLLLAGILGIACTFMDWIGFEDQFESGWKSIEGLDELAKAGYSYYRFGPHVAVAASIILVLIAGFHLIKSSPYQSSARTLTGILLIVLGIVIVGNSGAQYNAFDELVSDAAAEEMVFVPELQVGLGLAFSLIVGIIAVVLGIVALTVKSVIPSPAMAAALPVAPPPPAPPRY